MGKVNVSLWKEFVVKELFDIHPTKAYKDTNATLFDDDGTVPVVVNSAYNNGIGGYTKKQPTERGGIVTFSDTTSADSIFYHETDFVGYPHIQGLYPIKYEDKWNKYSLLFFATLFRAKALTLNYDYGNKFTRESAKLFKIKLPVYESGEPNWEYMEGYISSLEDNVEGSIKTLQFTKEIKKEKIDLRKWKRFHLYDDELFTIDAGTKLDKIKMSERCPSINFVGRANANNGVTGIIDEIDGLKPYEAGNLTVSLGGEYLGSCFVQRAPFYTSQNVNVLIPKWEMPEECKIFIATMIFKEGRTYYKAFVDELNRHMKTDFSIFLPVDSQEKPDWSFMKEYIKGIQKSVEGVYQNIHTIV